MIAITPVMGGHSMRKVTSMISSARTAGAIPSTRCRNTGPNSARTVSGSRDVTTICTPSRVKDVPGLHIGAASGI